LGSFIDSGSNVIEEEQKRIIPKPLSLSKINLVEDLCDFIHLQIFDEALICPFGGKGSDLPADISMTRFGSCYKLEESAQGSQPLVS